MILFAIHCRGETHKPCMKVPNITCLYTFERAVQKTREIQP